MRVIFWSEHFWPFIGGAEVWGERLILALRECGYEFVVVTRRDDPDLPKESLYKEIPVYRFSFWTAATEVDHLMEVRRQMKKLKRTFAPDLVHVNTLGPSVFFHLSTANSHPAPLLVSPHRGVFPGQVASRGMLYVEKQILCSADWVTCVSAATLDQWRQLVPEIIPRSSVIHNSLDLPPLLPEPLPTDAPRLLCLGRLDTVKGFDLALTAVASIVDRFSNLRLVIAGNGPERTRLQQQVVELGLTEVVDFVGWIAPGEVPALMNTATVVVMPSRHESFGLVALEAALMARPVVASRVGGLPEVIVHQQTGLLVEPEDSNALVEAIAFLLDRLETATQMGQAARQRAQEVFSWQQCVGAYDALYRTLIEGTLSQE